MTTLAEQREQARIEAGKAIKARNKTKAISALNEFIRIGIMEIESDRAMDEADDYYYNDWANE